MMKQSRDDVIHRGFGKKSDITTPPFWGEVAEFKFAILLFLYSQLLGGSATLVVLRGARHLYFTGGVCQIS